MKILYEANEIGTLSWIKIIDNGYGIAQGKLEEKFAPFFESEKMVDYQSSKNNSTFHGKNGIGRLTFFTFAEKAVWKTVYIENKKGYTYDISINAENLNQYSDNKSVSVKSKSPSGTVVTMTVRERKLIYI